MDAVKSFASATLNSLSRVSGSLAGKGAFQLFGMPMARSSLRPAERERLGTARREQLRINRSAVSVYRWGTGERPVLLVHGWQSRGSRLTDLVPGLLEQGRSVITFDAPAHGDSTGRSATIHHYREILSRLQERHGVFEAIVAHSVGVLGAFYSLAHGGVEARRLVSISGVCDFAHLVDEFCAILKIRDPLKAQLLREIGARLFPDLPADRMPFSITHAAEAVAIPALVVHDEHDDRIEVTQGRRIAAALGHQARLVITTGLGHRRILGDDEVIRTVLDFVAEDATRRDGPTAPVAAPVSAD
ncbi:pimeloyl-ACP methyl ester carboxylesterase [Actinoalloteichus hoggarensis]|uniref:Alpha/beta hydrolase family protein n=1 Tax=Actinoalloteichus hoggarensis TaxID=1470176 RepID=A0A221W5A3_9PSEU|nr:alpha/beta hydrolase [Actinoalloteichus hoggarensis]ASO20729.1 Alpha/beta hydrolase family protein [Actinoalloteichus hoggarensis]MBB5920659.1 pimeloyl-ACP methyl ester carboxylesterase [Actinoalloteichus hoggarensis]